MVRKTPVMHHYANYKVQSLSLIKYQAITALGRRESGGITPSILY
jgi:hypothetical protein